jgi:hypothetical protein
MEQLLEGAMIMRRRIPLFLVFIFLLGFAGLTSADQTDLVWSTFLGSTLKEYGTAIWADHPDGIYVTGYTYSSGFPTTPGAYQTVYGTSIDAFASKLNTSGSALIYSTFLGGDSGDKGHGIVVDDAGNAYVVGEVSSNDFPIVYGSYDTTHNTGEDVFITKLNASGNGLIYSTYLGGSSTDEGYAIALDAANRVCVTGFTHSSDFPATPGAFDFTANGWYDVFVARLNAAGSGLDYATYIGGADYDEGYGIAIDDAGHAYVAGYTSSSNYPTTAGAYDVGFNSSYDAFVTKVSPAGSSLVYSTFLGGSSYDYGYALALDDSGRAHITGATESGNFPTTAGAWDGSHNGSLDAFISRVDAAGAVLEYSTYLGGNIYDYGRDIEVHADGHIIVAGYANSTNFPTTSGSYDETHNGDYDAFASKLNPADSALVYSTYLGGSNREECEGIDLDDGGFAYIIGATESGGFPTTYGAYDTTINGQYDAFICKLKMVSIIAPPEAIDDLTATLSQTDIVLRWSAVTIDTSGTPLTVEGYIVYRDTVPEFTPGTPLDSTAGLMYTDDTGVVGDTGTNYYYLIKASAAGEVSAPSNTVGEFDADMLTAP